MIVAEKFIRSLASKYGKHTVYTDGGTWYPEACNVVRLKHYLHSSFEKSLMERVNQYFKDRTEGFDDSYPCMQHGCITNTTTTSPIQPPASPSPQIYRISL